MIAFAWGAFWIGAIMSPLVITVLVLTYWTITDLEMKKSRAVDREMEQRGKAVKESLYRQQREKIRKELG